MRLAHWPTKLKTVRIRCLRTSTQVHTGTPISKLDSFHVRRMRSPGLPPGSRHLTLVMNGVTRLFDSSAHRGKIHDRKNSFRFGGLTIDMRVLMDSYP
jgi:hypothetical protein